MYSHVITYRVCYADTDKMGYVYYGNYARLYEIARVETLRSLGVSYKVLEDNGIGLPENYNELHTNNIGFDLINGLSEQIDGKVNININKGTEISIEFKDTEK